MVSDIEMFKSHPDKPLLKHIQGVVDNVKKLTNSRFAELVAIFHDLGKINPNFQVKLDSQKKVNGYANHAYLSAYIFCCAFCFSRKNFETLKQFLHVKELNQNDLVALTVLIAKHHGNLPDFTHYPSDQIDEDESILSKYENFTLFKFLENEKYLPFYEFINLIFPVENFQQFLINPKIQQEYSEKFIFDREKNKSALDFFIDYQFTFACVIHADKADAGNIGNIIDEQKKAVLSFSEIFGQKLNTYLGNLKQDTKLNRLRTEIREYAVRSIRQGLKNGKRVFDLTAPTGSGKTLMMLSLAVEIIKTNGPKRIIYGLPFLSITEQVEAEVLKIFEDCEDFIQRIDSKSENHRFEKIQKELDNNPTEEKILEANILEFRENTFAYPFVITTFVRFFETLLSNQNAELLKLPNFSNCIFLLDEIQALPPRLYGFFVAYLSRFCEKFNSYAIISTATQPNFEIPNDNVEAQRFFQDYTKPYPLLPLSYFDNDLFNRYKIDYNSNGVTIETLKDQIISENSSVLVILNTIDDTKELYKKLNEQCCTDELILLNTHFTPNDRKRKIDIAKQKLENKQRVIIISTQLIEAGVDIDFPVLYRDFATIASIVQSAGRCNRNGKLQTLGKVVLFKLQKDGRARSEIIYKGKDSEILRFTKESFINEIYQEKELLAVQKDFFNRIQSELNFAKHSQNNSKFEFDFLKDIQECMYEKIGMFQLIDKQEYGEEFCYYVPKDITDSSFERLKLFEEELIDLLKEKAEISLIKRQKNKIKSHMKKMSNQIVQIRLKQGQTKPGKEDSHFSLLKIDNNYYSFETGIDLKGGESIL